MITSTNWEPKFPKSGSIWIKRVVIGRISVPTTIAHPYIVIPIR